MDGLIELYYCSSFLLLQIDTERNKGEEKMPQDCVTISIEFHVVPGIRKILPGELSFSLIPILLNIGKQL